jgi:hypothetical protein
MGEILPTPCALGLRGFRWHKAVAHRSTTYNDVRLVLIYDDGLLANQLNQLTNTANSRRLA